jgi:hypothetical protein
MYFWKFPLRMCCWNFSVWAYHNPCTQVAASKKQTVEEMMEEEFAQIIGHDSLKDQLRQFHKKVQLDVIRRKADPKQKRAAGLYHMLFMGYGLLRVFLILSSISLLQSHTTLSHTVQTAGHGEDYNGEPGGQADGEDGAD